MLKFLDNLTSAIGRWVERLFNKYKFMRRFSMFWAMGTVSYCLGLVTYVTLVMIEQNKFTEAMFLAIVGLVGTTIVLIGTMNALYQWDKALEYKFKGFNDDQGHS